MSTYVTDLVKQAQLHGAAARPANDERHASSDTLQKFLRYAQNTIDLLVSEDVIQGAGAPLLSRSDSHSRNIFVDPDDPTEITGIIDWMSAAVEPAFVFAAETPDFAAELPDNHALRQIFDREEGQDSAYARLRADADFCVKTWSLVPMICDKLREASQLDISVIRLLEAPRNGWLNDEDYLRPDLSAVARK